MTISSFVFADSALASDLLEYEVGFSIVEAATANAVLALKYTPDGGLPTQQAIANTIFGVSVVYHIDVIERAVASIAQKLGFGEAQTFHVVATDAIKATLAYAYEAHAVARDVLAPQVSHQSSLTDHAVARSVATIMNNLGASTSAIASDHVVFSHTAVAAIADSAVATVLLLEKKVLNAALIESALHTDAFMTNFIYNVSLHENVKAQVVNQEPGQSTVSTWAINTRTNAVTQYDNWSFNSFAAMGRKYIAADETGIYELNGPRDVTDNVVADMQGGFFQPADGKLAGFKGVYLAATGQGVWRLVLTAGDGREYVYERYSNPALMTTKMEVGKGLRSRYFGWELINADGQDFDLDRLEFVPMMSERRI